MPKANNPFEDNNPFNKPANEADDLPPGLDPIEDVNQQHDLKNFSPYADDTIPASATMTEKAPVKDFITLLLIVPVLPFYVIYLVIKGKNKKFITTFFGILIFFLGLAFLGYKQYALIKSKEHKVIKNIDDYLGETEIDQKKIENELKGKISTLASSIDVNLLPQQLKPLFYIQQDMLTINYYHYLISAGYMGKNAEGSVYILQNALYGKNAELSRAAYQSLELINTEEARNIINIYNSTQKKPAEENKTAAPAKTPSSSEDDLKTKYNKFKYKIENVH